MCGRQFPDDTWERVEPLRGTECVDTSSQTADEVLAQIEAIARRVIG